MRRIVVTEFASLDGVMEDPGGAEDHPHGGWSFKFQDPEGMKYKLDEVMEHDAMLLGGGKRVFAESRDAKVLRLADSKVLDSGTVILTYQRGEG